MPNSIARMPEMIQLRSSSLRRQMKSGPMQRISVFLQ